MAHRTVTDAAVALDLAPSSVSEQIRALERDLGVELFERGPRGMRPTAAGERLRGWARRLLEQADQARRDVAQARPVMRLGALETIAAVYVPAVLARLAEWRPDVVVEVRSDGVRDRLLDAVAAADLDAALLPWFAVADRVAAGALSRLAFDVPGLNLRLVWRADREALPGMREILYASAASEAVSLPPPVGHGAAPR